MPGLEGLKSRIFEGFKKIRELRVPLIPPHMMTAGATHAAVRNERKAVDKSKHNQLAN